MTRVKKLITLDSKNDDKLREASFKLRKPASHILDDLLCEYQIKMRDLN